MYPSVMIVDDEPSILKSLSGILSDEGFEIFTASNGYEALKRIEQEARTWCCWTSGCRVWTALKP